MKALRKDNDLKFAIFISSSTGSSNLKMDIYFVYILCYYYTNDILRRMYNGRK